MSYEKYYPGGWQSGESGGTPITPEALNHIENGIKQTYSDFAPAGYGLGGYTTRMIYSISELDNITANGWYKFYQKGAMLNNIWLNYAYFRVSNYGEGSHCLQELYPIGSNTPIVRRMFEGVWGAWESDKPPMEPSVEYRTTERHNGKVKYKKLISFGEFPQSTSKEVSTGIDANKYRIVSVHRHAKEIRNNADILYLASITHEYTVVYSGLYFIHVTTNGSQSVTAEYLFEYEEV